jgi:hypothetical protein
VLEGSRDQRCVLELVDIQHVAKPPSTAFPNLYVSSPAT